ncbi:MAG: hypothetical protein HN344_07700, partial [Gammaproteobacteria bacterium]|nr:hypothetical protein [Gammaproteobacteria bacterium]
PEVPAKLVSIEGNILKPGVYPLHQGMRILDLINASINILPETDMNYALMRRVQGMDRHVEVHSFSLAEILADNEDSDNLSLYPEDQLIILSLDENRAARILNLITDLQKQVTHQKSAPVVSVGGWVKFPGQYPLEEGMKVGDLLQAAGGVREQAYTESAELTRRAVVDGEYRTISHQEIPLNTVAGVERYNQTLLQPFDVLRVKQMPLWGETRTVALRGEFRFPGLYTLSRGETLKQLIARAGGLTDEAFVNGAIFSRVSIQQREKKSFLAMADQLEKEIHTSALKMEGESRDETDRQQAMMMVDRLRETDPVGRLAIPLMQIIESEREDILLMAGDQLIVPPRTQTVTVLGEVFAPTSHLYRKGMRTDDYINASGGATLGADLDRTYIVTADGSTVTADGGGRLADQTRESWFDGNQQVSVGDTIIVPLNMDNETFWSKLGSISEIFYQLSLTVAALSSVGAL